MSCDYHMIFPCVMLVGSVLCSTLCLMCGRGCTGLNGLSLVVIQGCSVSSWLWCVLVTMVMCVVITIYPADASEIKYMYMLLS